MKQKQITKKIHGKKDSNKKKRQKTNKHTNKQANNQKKAPRERTNKDADLWRRAVREEERLVLRWRLCPLLKCCLLKCGRSVWMSAWVGEVHGWMRCMGG